MFVISQYSFTVICLTIVTFTRSLPTKNMSDEMSGALSCTFLQKYINDTKRYCSQVDLDNYDDKFHRIYYACMELFDVSIQLCEIGKDVNSVSLMVPKAKEFCKELKFYDKRAEATENWAGIAVKFLSSPGNCEKVCISENSIHPICEAIYLGNINLIKTAKERRVGPSLIPVAHDNVSATTHSQSNPTPAEIQSNTQFDQALHDKESIKPVPKKFEKLKNSKEEKKSNPDNPVIEEFVGKKIPGERISDPLKKSIDSTSPITDKKKKPGSIHLEEAQPILQAKPVADVKPIDDTQSFASNQQFPDQKHIDNEPQILGKQLSEGGLPLTPAFLGPSVTPSAVHEPFYKDSGDDHDDIRDSSKDADTENEGIGDVSFKEDTGLSIIAQEDSPNNDASGEPEENLGIAGNKYSSRFPHAQDSHFFAYFLTMVVICIVGYLVFHNKQKIIALALEGRRMQGSRRRPNTSSYKKLDSNLEEAVTSNCSSSSVTHVIF